MLSVGIVKPLNTYLSLFFETNQMIIHICTSEILKSKWILCSQKIGVKCSYLRFLTYKIIPYLYSFLLYDVLCMNLKEINFMSRCSQQQVIEDISCFFLLIIQVLGV